MKIKIGLPHDFKKRNLVTQHDRKGGYDYLVCEKCGISGKSRQLGTIEIEQHQDPQRIEFCKNVEIIIKKVKITDRYLVNNFGFIADSVHDVVTCPDVHKGKYGQHIWVYSESRGEPVRIMPGEFEIVD